jgi:integrase
MASRKLTKTVVEAEPASASDTYLWDTQLPRFGVRITPVGAKQKDGTPRPPRRIYLIQYRVKATPGEPAKHRRITIGQHGRPWTVDEARAEAKLLLARVDLRNDPFADREADAEAKHRAKLAAAAAVEAEAHASTRRSKETYAALMDRYTKLRSRPTRAWEETERLLRFGAPRPPEGQTKRGSGRPHRSDTPGPMKAWADTHIAEIRRADVRELLDDISERSPSVARATFAALRPFFDWCVERDLIDRSPCEKLTAPPRPTARDRVLLDAELGHIWNGAGALGYPFGPIVQLLMLTGQRRSEVAGMTWSELDLAAERWRIPAERTKNGQAHEIDLGPEALAVIQALPKSEGHLFPARGEGAVRGFSATKRRLDGLIAAAAAKAEDSPPSPWRLHDLRRTAATGMAAMAFPPHVVERVLNHVSGVQSGLVGVYQRHEYRPERKAALVAWGAHVAGVVTGIAPPSNVHRLRA